MRYSKMFPTAVNTRGDAVRIMHTTRKTIRHIPLMARSSMLCGMDDRVKHACTIGYSIPPITSGFIDRQALAIRCVSPFVHSWTQRRWYGYSSKVTHFFDHQNRRTDIRTNELEANNGQNKNYYGDGGARARDVGGVRNRLAAVPEG